MLILLLLLLLLPSQIFHNILLVAVTEETYWYRRVPNRQTNFYLLKVFHFLKITWSNNRLFGPEWPSCWMDQEGSISIVFLLLTKRPYWSSFCVKREPPSRIRSARWYHWFCTFLGKVLNVPRSREQVKTSTNHTSNSIKLIFAKKRGKNSKRWDTENSQGA